MAIRTKGDLRSFTVRDEATYGVFNTSASSAYGGVLSGWDDGLAYEYIEDDPQQEGETFSDIVKGPASYGFTADMKIPRGNSILAAWLKKATGAASGATGPKRDISPFSAVFMKGPDEYLAYFGCKIDSFQIKASERGKPVEFSAQAFARYMAMKSTEAGTFDNLGTTVTFPALSRPTGAPVTYCAPLKVNNTDVKAKSWSITISNGLEREADAVIINNVCYPLSAGLDSIPADKEVTIEITRAVDGATWDTASKDGTTGQTITVTLDGVTITLGSCYLVPSMSKATQGTYDETLTFRAKTITYATS